MSRRSQRGTVVSDAPLAQDSTPSAVVDDAVIRLQTPAEALPSCAVVAAEDSSHQSSLNDASDSVPISAVNVNERSSDFPPAVCGMVLEENVFRKSGEVVEESTSPIRPTVDGIIQPLLPSDGLAEPRLESDVASRSADSSSGGEEMQFVDDEVDINSRVEKVLFDGTDDHAGAGASCCANAKETIESLVVESDAAPTIDVQAVVDTSTSVSILVSSPVASIPSVLPIVPPVPVDSCASISTQLSALVQYCGSISVQAVPESNGTVSMETSELEKSDENVLSDTSAHDASNASFPPLDTSSFDDSDRGVSTEVPDDLKNVKSSIDCETQALSVNVSQSSTSLSESLESSDICSMEVETSVEADASWASKTPVNVETNAPSANEQIDTVVSRSDDQVMRSEVLPSDEGRGETSECSDGFGVSEADVMRETAAMFNETDPNMFSDEEPDRSRGPNVS